jgi:copper(I)-binding protein
MIKNSPIHRRALGLLVMLSAFAPAAEVAPGIQVKDAWIRWLPANVPSAGYMTLINTGTAAGVLVSASSPDFGQVSFHESLTKNGMSEMVAVSTLTVKPQSSLRFSPGGYHMMLMQPKRALRPGDRVAITLQFADGHSLQAPFEVRGAGERGHPDEGGDMPGMQ